MFLSEALEEFQKIYILMLVKGLAQINVSAIMTNVYLFISNIYITI